MTTKQQAVMQQELSEVIAEVEGALWNIGLRPVVWDKSITVWKQARRGKTLVADIYFETEGIKVRTRFGNSTFSYNEIDGVQNFVGSMAATTR